MNSLDRRPEDMNSPDRSSPLDQHRIVVADATFDELEDKFNVHQEHEQKEDASVASTVDVDNTHPYLMRFAEIYADENNNTDASSTADTGPTFVDVKPPSQFKEGEKVMYKGGKDLPSSEAVVTKIMYDEKRHPHYTIKMTPSMEEQMINGATDEKGEAPTNCVNFKTNPTPLFQFLYQGKWLMAEKCLQNSPDEAKVWVARYAKKSSTDEEVNIRWQLLPLHLFVALADTQKKAADETNNKVLEVERDESKTPPLGLLVALLKAYPQSTQCTDDQGLIPLQSAIRGNSSLEVIDILLAVDPTSVYRKDARGRNAFVLAEKVYGTHKKQVGLEDEDRQKKYAQLMQLLSNASTRVSSPRKSQPMNKTQRLLKLQNENLALRRENAMLHHRAEINTRLLQQLVEKLQVYEDQRKADIENYDQIFGSKDELDERREEILVSISEDAGDDNDEEENNAKKEDVEQNENEDKEQKKEDVHSNGAYHKRLERYLYSTPTKNKEGTSNIVSPTSTEATEVETPDRLGEESEILSVSDYSNTESQDIFRPRDTDVNAEGSSEPCEEQLDTTEVARQLAQKYELDSLLKVATEDSESHIDTAETGAVDTQTNDQKKLTTIEGDYVVPTIMPVLSSEEEEQLVVE